jgi:glycerol-1-phosphate dehydrogenase [NAD(P)+]
VSARQDTSAASSKAPLDRYLSAEFLGKAFDCECGRTHTIATRQVHIETGVAALIPDVMTELIPGRRLLLLADANTWRVAGAQLADALAADFNVTVHLVEPPAGGHICASVDLVSALLDRFPGDIDVLAAVGSGTINDLAKDFAARRGLPYFVLATAPSMNGYTSAIVALLDNGLKTTSPATPPIAVFADPDVLSAAPMELILAGLGDLVSKPVCGCDWLIASLVKDEYYCPLPGSMMTESFESALGTFARLRQRDSEAVTTLMKLLTVSGLSMAIAGTSSPASGGEHLISHYWDMIHIRDGHPLGLHGAQVGVGTMISLALYERVRDCDFAAASFAPAASSDEARSDIAEIFASLAGAVTPQWLAKLEQRSPDDLRLLTEHQVEIKAEIDKSLRVGQAVRQALRESGAPTSAHELGISESELRAAILHSRKIRTRFTVLDVAAELGLLDDFASDYPLAPQAPDA